MNIYQMRFAMIQLAQAMLFDDWRNRQDIEKTTANWENRAPAVLPAPTTEQVLAQAKKMRHFVVTGETA